MKKIGFVWGYVLILFYCLLSCSEQDVLEATESESMNVPFSIELIAHGKELETRATTAWHDTLKPNPRPVAVDKVMVIVYRRPSDGQYQNNLEGFVSCQSFGVRAVETFDNGKQPRYIARGVVQLQGGYTYRMTAIAYSEQQKEHQLFQLNESLLSYTEIELTDRKEYRTPELFFGAIVHQERDTLFNYSAVKESKADLTGWLYRGVAGVELNLINVPKEVRTIELLADSIHTRVKARIYDDFHHAYAKQRDGSFQHYVIGRYERNDAVITHPATVQIVGSNLLEICTSLSLRITLDKKNGKPGETEQIVTRLQVREKVQPNPIVTKSLRSIPGDAGNGTGIIPGGNKFPIDPSNPDKPQAPNPYRICFKRNHYYKLAGDYQKLTTLQYVMQVTVNPNWEGSVNLPLDK